SSDRPELLPGWIATPPAENASTDPAYQELAQWLRDRADNIADRVHELGERLATDPPDWTTDLGPVPDNVTDRENWIARAGHVAAYRERWSIPDRITELLPEHHRGEQGRAREWVADRLNQAPAPT